MSDTSKSDIEATMEHGAVTKMGSTISSASTKRRGMESSVLKFSNVSFTVGKGDKKKYLLADVNATVKWGRVLASKYMWRWCSDLFKVRIENF